MSGHRDLRDRPAVRGSGDRQKSRLRRRGSPLGGGHRCQLEYRVVVGFGGEPFDRIVLGCLKIPSGGRGCLHVFLQHRTCLEGGGFANRVQATVPAAREAFWPSLGAMVRNFLTVVIGTT